MRGSRNAVIEDGQILKRSFTESYIVTSDDGTDDEGNVYATSGLPTVGDDWVGQNGSTNTGVTVVRVKISDHDATKKLWIVEVDYSSELPDGGNASNPSGSPTDWSPQIEWTAEKLPFKVREDTSGKPLVNPLGDLYDVEEYRPLSVLRYSRWQVSFTSATQLAFMNRMNSDVFLGWPPLTALMDEISAEARFIQGFQFWWVTYIVIFEPKTWIEKIPVSGGRYLGTAGDFTTVTSALSDNGVTRVNLNRDGTIREFTPPDFDYFQTKETANFTPLILGSS